MYFRLESKLESKLKSYGIGGVVSEWITKCLADRVQRVIINGHNSE